MRPDRWMQMLVMAGGAWAVTATPALAWTRAGHMVTAAIAYDELAARDPKAIEQIVEIVSRHPEHGPFEVAIGRATGAERTRRIFLEIARWPDDVRGGAQDHPTWHAAIRPLIDPTDPPPSLPADSVAFEAYEALPLNVHVAADPDQRVPVSERAVALCWIFHIVGDMHQPLHATQLYSGTFPNGDGDGALAFVLDPKTHQPVTLHWYWDDLVSQSDEPEAALARARELETRYPRAQFEAELAADRTRPNANADVTSYIEANVPAWGNESYAVAKSVAYSPNRPRATTWSQAKAPDDAYLKESKLAAERRLTLAGYRLTDLILRMFPQK